MTTLAERALAAFIGGAFDRMADQADELLDRARRDAPGLDGGDLKDSMRVVYLVNGAELDERAAARAAAIAAAHDDGRLSMDAEVQANTPYAAAQHEGHALQRRHGRRVHWNLGAEHRSHVKYLERNLLEMLPDYTPQLAAGAGAELGGRTLTRRAAGR